MGWLQACKAWQIGGGGSLQSEPTCLIVLELYTLKMKKALDIQCLVGIGRRNTLPNNLGNCSSNSHTFLPKSFQNLKLRHPLPMVRECISRSPRPSFCPVANCYWYTDFVYLLFYVAFSSQGHITTGSLQVEETSAYCTVNHRASASNYQLSNMKLPVQDSNRRPQRLEARTLTATPPSPLDILMDTMARDRAYIYLFSV